LDGVGPAPAQVAEARQQSSRVRGAAGQGTVPPRPREVAALAARAAADPRAVRSAATMAADVARAMAAADAAAATAVAADAVAVAAVAAAGVVAAVAAAAVEAARGAEFKAGPCSDDIVKPGSACAPEMTTAN
jgi:colicin import membrane protein